MPLTTLPGHPFELRASAGAGEQAHRLAARAEVALAWHADQLGWRPDFRLTVADGDDWAEAAPVPIYGVPQTWDDHTILAAGRAPLFDEIADALRRHCGADADRRLVEAYGDPPDLTGFFEQFLVHELVHLFCEQVPVRPAPLWFTELLCNLGMVGELAANEPGALAGVRAVADAAAHLPVSSLAVHALDDMERSFEAGNINFGWYILQLTALADTLWHTDGGRLYTAGYRLLRSAGEGPGVGPALTGAEIAGLSDSLAAAMASWPAVPAVG